MQTRSIVAPVARLAAAGGAALAYAGLVERNIFRLRRFDVPVLAPGAPPLTVLHLSDLHLTPGQRRKRAWIRDLDRLAPAAAEETTEHRGGHRDRLADGEAHPDAEPLRKLILLRAAWPPQVAIGMIGTWAARPT